MNANLIMDDGVDMKIVQIGYVLLIAIAAFVALPAHGADLDSANLYRCVKLDNEMIVHYNCKEPATVAFCFENIVMKQNAAEVDIEFARDLHCQARSGFHDPCFFYGSVRKCGNIRGQAWANRIATYTVVYGVCPRAGNVPRWVSNPGSNGRYTCDSDPMEGSESDDGSAETLSEDDQYERLFGEYENRLSELLDGDLSSAENLGEMLVESLGGELSFDDVLGNFGMEQTASGDQGTEQVASVDQESKQGSLSASSATCKEYLSLVERYFKANVNLFTSEMNLHHATSEKYLYEDPEVEYVEMWDNLAILGTELSSATESIIGESDRGFAAIMNIYPRYEAEYFDGGASGYLLREGFISRAEYVSFHRHVNEAAKLEYLNANGVCGY